MTLDQAIIEVQQICGWRSDKVSVITAALSYAQIEREKPGITFPPWLWKEDIALPPLTIGSQTLALPTDFIQDSEEKDGNLRYGPVIAKGRTIFLQKMQLEIAEKFYFGDWSATSDTNGNETFAAISPGPPKAYVLRKNSIKVYPAPDQAYVLTWSYWGADTAQAMGQENGWLKNAPWVLIADAAKKIGSDLGNANAVATATSIGTMAEANMFRATIHRQEAGKSRNMGSRL